MSSETVSALKSFIDARLRERVACEHAACAAEGINPGSFAYANRVLPESMRRVRLLAGAFVDPPRGLARWALEWQMHDDFRSEWVALATDWRPKVTP